MTFTEEELDLLLNKKVDQIVFTSGNEKVFKIDINKLLNKKIESDPNLKRQLLKQALQSEG